ncbi:MAG: LysM peptidoglycan-binding domain-containing protein [bacterium]|nr:LysM peptidoglycan-binding domain-containing protein [bacterium]
MQTYVVQPGDTLYGISGQFGVSVEDIMFSNNLSSSVVFVGQILKIPSSSTTALYVVKAQDTLYSIARKYSTTVDEIMRLNNLTSKILSIGQQLRIPINVDTSTTDYILYSVKVGDTLYKIAKNSNVSVAEIKELNKLQSDLLSIGQQLKIPISNNNDLDNYKSYIVKSGDTLYSIASNYRMSVDELMSLNNLSSINLKVGQVLKVKENYYSNIPMGSKCYGTGYQEPNYLTYIVKTGDNLYTIARKYSTSVDNLMKLNNLDSTNLAVGQILKIKEV